ncbi:MAG TPA: acyclic terpene utilization AtuA family protein [Burkholderiaceae bacterium]|nr:acyclic terpene utilization AtuA family protein [Burkholderiaceae bacterium]
MTIDDTSESFMEVRVLAATGVLGAGFKVDSLRRGVELNPSFIACDAGSTDSGPAYLGSGKPKLSRDACKRDLRLLLRARDTLKVPLIIGSCGTSGRDEGVDWVADMAREIAAEEHIHFRTALIKSDQSAAYLKMRLEQGRIRPLHPAPVLTKAVIESSHVVGMMGAEPIAAAIAEGAVVVLAGRASDPALFAAIPLMHGAPPGLVWHAAKTLECGAVCAVVPAADGMFAVIRDDHFDIEPLDLAARCTPQSIAAHMLYENADPFLLTEPSGVINTQYADYVANSERSVRVSGSRFTAAEEYTIKLEGAQLVGHQTAVIGGIRDPHIIRSLDTLLPKAKAYFDVRIADLFPGQLSSGDYDISYRIYGRDAVMGRLEPMRQSPVAYEVGVLITITAPSQDLANKIATLVSHVSAHLPVPEYQGLISSIAYPFSPPELPRGPVYRFSLNHVVIPDDPCEMFRTEIVEI